MLAKWAISLQDHRTQKRVFVLSVLIPMFIFFFTFYIYPLFAGLAGSMTDWRAFQAERPFIGLDNYLKLLRDDTFLAAARNTLLYSAMYLPISMILSLVLALAIDASGFFKSLFRTVYFVPVVTSVIATALIWGWLYQPRYGLFNQVLTMLGINRMQFLNSPAQALPSIVAYAVWKQLGYNIVLFMAGLTSIDSSYYAAARVDGAGRLQVLRHITLPLLQPTTVFVFITGIISSLQVFGPIFVMTSASSNDLPGGPLDSTIVISVYQWEVAFRELNLGYGAAMGIVLFVIILVITLFNARILRRRWDY